MDRDTTTRKGAHHRLVTAMAAGDFDILVGTQMIAKGHDFAQGDPGRRAQCRQALNLPDFRSAERVFSLLSQAAGRAGRGERPGQVLIQTWSPDHYALEFVARHDYHGFAAVELPQRQSLGYPPFGHLVNLVLSGNDAAAGQCARPSCWRAAWSARTPPSKCSDRLPACSTLRGKTRVQLLLKAPTRAPLAQAARPAGGEILAASGGCRHDG